MDEQRGDVLLDKSKQALRRAFDSHSNSSGSITPHPYGAVDRPPPLMPIHSHRPEQNATQQRSLHQYSTTTLTSTTVSSESLSSASSKGPPVGFGHKEALGLSSSLSSASAALFHSSSEVSTSSMVSRSSLVKSFSPSNTGKPNIYDVLLF